MFILRDYYHEYVTKFQVAHYVAKFVVILARFMVDAIMSCWIYTSFFNG